jgi:hypothetical protein
MASILQPTLQLEDWSLGYECPDLSARPCASHIPSWLLGLQRSNGLNFSTKITKTHVLTWCGKCRAFVDPPCIFFGVGGGRSNPWSIDYLATVLDGSGHEVKILL